MKNRHSWQDFFLHPVRVRHIPCTSSSSIYYIVYSTYYYSCSLSVRSCFPLKNDTSFYPTDRQDDRPSTSSEHILEAEP